MKRSPEALKSAGGRPKHNLTRAQMIQAAQLFYNDGMTRQVIAHQLDIEVRKVTRLLKQAHTDGIVRIIVDKTVESDLVPQILQKFRHLKDVLIVEDGPQVEAPGRWGAAAANYFTKLWNEHKAGQPFHVALTGGQVFLEVVNALRDERRADLYVHVPALIGHGRLTEESTHIDALAIASMLWARSGRIPGHLEYATVPPHPTIAKPGPAARLAVGEELATLAANRAIRDVVTAMNDLDVVFSRIGRIEPQASEDVRKRHTMENYLRHVVTTKDLHEEGAVGAFSYCLFDKDGNGNKRWQFFLSAGHGTPHWGINFFKRMVASEKTVVAVGDYLPAVRAALKGKIFNVWITDRNTARQIAEGQ